MYYTLSYPIASDFQSISKSLVGIPERQSETINDSSFRPVPCELMEPMGEVSIVYVRIQRGTKAMKTSHSKYLISQLPIVNKATNADIEEVAKPGDNDAFNMGYMTHIGQTSIQHKINSMWNN
ncbi:hypothetical protein IFM58399_01676 [Aspergillus lentulus]|uniref:Uncharacterized protein n=1 Tax=Aspergillus lentulus TaxID=293939 RepID=A0ABQ1ASG5_ASPLE|nr:uncharacterized protein IFM58399_01676 [Aspergillus lentulus]KAF4162828.1 hypothetical protein CNMCM6936_001596 [Aspergillus lentulus]GFF27377.1 hypothetical protein IFM58399_01676 [Aspergillus lentulus]GFF48538.1 hypothetical protein IFM62136_01048 [Aspergillus lentulus]GFF82665.1 hypothetical protein IFM47457_05883 [Aspergillus lentulus]GFF87049.1 hypothetical protein IFM60648_07910 [Aspergillus lentulus]